MRCYRLWKAPDLLGQIQIVRLFKWRVCFKLVVCELYITNDHHTQSGILLGVRCLATNRHDPAIFVPLLEMECKLYYSFLL